MTLVEIQAEAYANSSSKGFWDLPRNKGEMIALMHSELSELLEAVRKAAPPQDDHIPEFTQEAAELADVIIRVADYARGFGIDLEKVVIAKMAYNRNRPHMHGKMF